MCPPPTTFGFTTTITPSRSIAATATFSVTGSLTALLLHGALVPVPGDPSLGAHGVAFLATGFAALASTFAASRVTNAGVLARQAVAFCSAFAFALSLRLSNLSDPRRVLAFLLTPAHTAFDPSLVYLAVGALPLASVLYRVGSVRLERKGKVDGRLFAGAALFGIGWGIAGICRKSSSHPPYHGCYIRPGRLLTTITVSYSRSRVGQLRLGTRIYCRHKAPCDVVVCRYYWRLLDAVITFHQHFSTVLIPC